MVFFVGGGWVEGAEVSSSGQSQTLICGELKSDVQMLVGFTVSIRGKFQSSGVFIGPPGQC